mmetsp:Transcript_11851/g.22574  ORF Transcript_11851/g.22574 Transcript_11851/m.22574 type:complete len:214 (-) Transcript_11851:183-824(-)
MSTMDPRTGHREGQISGPCHSTFIHATFCLQRGEPQLKPLSPAMREKLCWVYSVGCLLFDASFLTMSRPPRASSIMDCILSSGFKGVGGGIASSSSLKFSSVSILVFALLNCLFAATMVGNKLLVSKKKVIPNTRPMANSNSVYSFFLSRGLGWYGRYASGRYCSCCCCCCASYAAAAGLGYTASMVMGDTSKLAAASAETHGRAPRSEFAAH